MTEHELWNSKKNADTKIRLKMKTSSIKGRQWVRDICMFLWVIIEYWRAQITF